MDVVLGIPQILDMRALEALEELTSEFGEEETLDQGYAPRVVEMEEEESPEKGYAPRMATMEEETLQQGDAPKRLILEEEEEEEEEEAFQPEKPRLEDYRDPKRVSFEHPRDRICRQPSKEKIQDYLARASERGREAEKRARLEATSSSSAVQEHNSERSRDVVWIRLQMINKLHTLLIPYVDKLLLGNYENGFKADVQIGMRWDGSGRPGATSSVDIVNVSAKSW